MASPSSQPMKVAAALGGRNIEEGKAPRNLSDDLEVVFISCLFRQMIICRIVRDQRVVSQSGCALLSPALPNVTSDRSSSMIKVLGDHLSVPHSISMVSVTSTCQYTLV